MLKIAPVLVFVLLFTLCESLSGSSSSSIGTVVQFRNEADLRSQLLKLVDADKKNRVKRGASAASMYRSRAKRQAAGAPAANTSIEDNHNYYTKKILVNHRRTLFFTNEFDRIFATYPARSHVRMNNGHNLAWIVPTKFSFPFYGHDHSHIVITTAGYLYINNVTHSTLGFAQYIAPLKANYDTLHSTSSIKFVDAEDSVWVRWENMQLNENRTFGNFSFQCGVYKNGSVVFDYISLPARVKELRNFTRYSVAVGMSDAFYNDTRINTTHIRRLIVKYHSIDVDLSLVTNDTVVEFSHLTTCNQLKSCRSCVDPNRAKNFKCSWCAKLRACSSGVDRSTQKWMLNSCHMTANTPDGCRPRTDFGVVLLIVLAVVVVGGLIACLVTLLVYGYRNPNSGVGMWLIEHRPSQLRQRLADVRFSRSGGGASSGGDAYKVDMGSSAYANMDA